MSYRHFYILHFVFYILHFVFYILHFSPLNTYERTFYARRNGLEIPFYSFTNGRILNILLLILK